MIYSDKHIGAKIAGHKEDFFIELAVLIQMLYREDLLDLDELYEVNEKALTSEESLIAHFNSNSVKKSVTILDMVQDLDLAISNIVGCEPRFKSKQEIEKCMREHEDREY